ncbi:MAG TPA: hypothetical protein PL143_10405 [Rhodocyclaceae bacterium]|nr:hypothetical protein [Rhodocyclaceae bacterium]
MKQNAHASVFALACAGIASLMMAATPAFAAQVCSLTDQSTKEILPGVIVTWDSSFHCFNAPESGEYMITVRVSNAESSVEAVTVETLRLRHTTPRPRGRAPAATASAEPAGLPITVDPGSTEGFAVMGEYELVRTDEGMKANLHLAADGFGDASLLPFSLGINVHLRGEGATE